MRTPARIEGSNDRAQSRGDRRVTEGEAELAVIDLNELIRARDEAESGRLQVQEAFDRE